jgi:hypothetical protein
MVVGLSAAFAAGCEDELPTSVGGDVPAEPVSVEVLIPWSDFASNLAVFGGYGSPAELGEGVIANAYEGTLTAHTLVDFLSYPTVATVRDATGTLRPDSSLTYVGGRLVAFFDTIASTNTGPVTLGLGALQSEWNERTASWTLSVDTINNQQPWPEPGAGPVVDFGTAVWDPAEGDSAVFVLDSAMVAAWADTLGFSSGARLELIDPGSRLTLRNAALRVDSRPTLDPDTIVELFPATDRLTFVYDPFPTPPADGVRIGGAPAWRTILDVGLPQTLDGPPAFCAVVSCPHTLEPGEISYAALVLTSRASEAAFQPTDSILLDVRPVFSRAAMPKSPLGTSLTGGAQGRAVPAAAFGSAPGVTVEIPFTSYARDLLRGEDEAGNPAPPTLALLSVFEPYSIAFASFEGPGSASEPMLRLVLTIGPPVELP